MMQSRLVRSSRYGLHAALIAAIVTSSIWLPGEARAASDDRERCASAADQAQQLRDEGKYRRAREQLLVCGRDVCPAPIKHDCLDWLAQLEVQAPTVVFSATDAGKDVADVKVSVDGVQVTERLDGKPVQMDLGKHTIKFDYQGSTKEEDIIIGAGQKNRNVSATFGTGDAPSPAPSPGPAAPAPRQSSTGSLVPALIVGGVGVVGIGAWAFFGLSGQSDVDDLKKTCSPNCAESDVDKARTKLIIADISLGVGVVALGVATYLFIARPKADVDVRSGQFAPSASGRATAARKVISDVTFDVGMLNGGAQGSVGARF